jgi:hypothetical protein
MNRRDLAAFLGSPQAIREYEQSLASYTLTDLDNGYDNPDPEAPNPGTTTPTVPTLSVQGEYKAFVLRWERQTNLTNFDEYEVQVSNDDATWYSLSFSGSDWKATLDATTPWASELLVHPNLPFGGTPEAPTALTLYYRVRRVTKEPVASSWSSSASATNLRIETGDIAADAITANKIDVSDLSAINADLGTITAGTIRSEDWDSSDGVEFDLSTGRLRMGGSSAPDIDLDPDSGTYEFAGDITLSGTMTTEGSSVDVRIGNGQFAFYGGTTELALIYPSGGSTYWNSYGGVTGTPQMRMSNTWWQVQIIGNSRYIRLDTSFSVNANLSVTGTMSGSSSLTLSGGISGVTTYSGSSYVQCAYTRGTSTAPSGNSAVGDGNNDALDKIHIRSTTGSQREMDYSSGW